MRDPAMRAVLTIVWLLVLAAIAHFLAVTYQKYGDVNAGSYSLFSTRREWLWAHLSGATLTLLLGPFQFLTPLRVAYPRVHRWTGRLYLLAMLVACAGAVGLIVTTPAGIGIQVAFAATELAWLSTAVMGFVAIRGKRMQVHRRWMIRNYIITFVFITFRVALMIPTLMALGPPSVMIPVLLELSWVIPLVVYELSAAAFGRATGRLAAQVL